jgi:hypothetical protein
MDIVVPNKPGGADRRQLFSFQQRVGEAHDVGIKAVAAHLERC